MGEVYRARDTRVGREVAIKVSAEGFGERFEREAQTIAALNHPNICTLYDVGPDYLVMELVEGESPKGPLPLETALDYARQIAAALEAAHERGIVHRDLKPANIKITPQGVVKVLDFGLAKVVSSDPAKTFNENSPTFSMAATQAGMIVGTAAYMAPEQARGLAMNLLRRAPISIFGFGSSLEVFSLASRLMLRRNVYRSGHPMGSKWLFLPTAAAVYFRFIEKMRPAAAWKRS